jgi:hypothetical protein
VKYLKTILTIIAVLLALNIAKEYLPRPARAGGRQSVSIDAVNGTTFLGWAVPVTVLE